MTKNRKPFTRPVNKVEYHTVPQGNGLYKVQRLTIRPNKTYATHTVAKNLTQEKADQLQFLKSRGR